MSSIPRSVLSGSASQAFMDVFAFHACDDPAVLDLTYGTGLSWKDFGLFMPVKFTPSDIKEPYCQDMLTAIEDRPQWKEAFDVVFYDPPYFEDIRSRSSDPRQEAYGGYAVSADMLDRFKRFAGDLSWFVRPGGKVILKCQDQYHVKHRRLLLHHVDWIRHLSSQRMTVVDLFVYPYHRVSPTAYQVKDRPSSVVAHTYFIVGQKACTSDVI